MPAISSLSVGGGAGELASLGRAAGVVADGGRVIVVDDVRQPTSAIMMAGAHAVTAETVNAMATHARGLVCVCLTPAACDRLGLPPMPVVGWDRPRAAFTISVDARVGTTTGISAAERALTARVLSDRASGPGDLLRPGHVFPVRAHPEGVVEGGVFEGAMELVRLAGTGSSAAVTCEVLDDRGEVAGLSDALALANRLDMVVVSLRQLRGRLITGVVVAGDGRGRDLGFPTANIRPAPSERLPAHGVYVGRALGLPAAVSIGVRPTFGDRLERLVEVHLLDFEGDLYERELTVELMDYVRPEERFDSVDALIAQIERDVEVTRRRAAAIGAGGASEVGWG